MNHFFIYRMFRIITCVLIFFTTKIEAHFSITLTKRQQCDLELILNGGFAPLSGFMSKDDYDHVIEEMRLADGTVWPMPITLDVSDKHIPQIHPGETIELRTAEQFVMATMEVKDIWQPDKTKEAALVYGTQAKEHPGVAYLFDQTESWYVGGTVKEAYIPTAIDFTELRKTPTELKEFFKKNNINKIVAFQTRNPMHRAHVELTLRAAKEHEAHLLIHPVVGMTKPGDIDATTRVRCYKKLVRHYPENSTTLALLPIAMRMAGPREALWHAIIRKNYGCTHFIVGRDHAGPGSDKSGKPFYGPYDAQELVKQYAAEIGIEMIPFKEMVYVVEHDAYFPTDEVPKNATVWSISGTQLRNLLATGSEIPSWFTYPDVVEELRLQHPPRSKQGFTIFFTGFSGAGKSTIANLLQSKLMEIQNRKVTMLDGDILRTYLSRELGFSREHRAIHVQRVGYVASEITKHGGIALCALIAPFEADRIHNKQLISQEGGYIEIHISTPLEICEQRDVKGLYQKAREGKIPQFTGVNDPYEIPTNPSLTIDSSIYSAHQAVDLIINYLQKEGYL